MPSSWWHSFASLLILYAHIVCEELSAGQAGDDGLCWSLIWWMIWDLGLSHRREAHRNSIPPKDSSLLVWELERKAMSARDKPKNSPSPVSEDVLRGLWKFREKFESPLKNLQGPFPCSVVLVIRDQRSSCIIFSRRNENHWQSGVEEPAMSNYRISVCENGWLYCSNLMLVSLGSLRHLLASAYFGIPKKEALTPVKQCLRDFPVKVRTSSQNAKTSLFCELFCRLLPENEPQI